MRMRLLLLIITAITIVSCNDARKSETFRVLEDVDSYIEARPDSALAVLEGISEEDLGSREEKAKYALLMSMALDKNYVDRTDFEVLQPAIDYYEDHGTATDKLRTFYYQGRIFYNKGELEKTMECLIKSIDLGKDSDDIITKARNYYLQSSLYVQYYNREKIIECSLAAAEYYKTLERYDNYVLMLCRASESYFYLGDIEAAQKYLSECESYIEIITNRSKAYYYAMLFTHNYNNLSKDEVSDIISDYMKIIPQDEVDWVAIAYTYFNIGNVNSAKNALNNYQEGYNNDPRYFAVLTKINKAEESYKEALASYERFSYLTDSLDFIALSQETQFVEERHGLEVAALKEREAKNNRTIIILICIIALLVALIAIYLIRKQLQIRTAEKKQLEIEKKRYEQLYADAIAERDALTKMIEDSSVKDETKAVIRERLEVLNKVIISHITDTSSANKKAFQELEALVADRDSFIVSTRLTIEGNNPEFIAALKKQGLTDEEINICCLYVIGLKGKDIKAYTSQPRHYNQSADIRHKLGLTENDTNLSIFLREMLEK